MKRAITLIFLVGCEFPAEYEGDWYMGQEECAMRLEMHGSAYTLGWGCDLPDGSVGAEFEKGSYSVKDGKLRLKAAEWTCPDKVETEFGMQVDDQQMTLVTPSGALFLKKVGGQAVSAKVVYGCFDENGAFTPSGLRPAQ